MISLMISYMISSNLISYTSIIVEWYHKEYDNNIYITSSIISQNTSVISCMISYTCLSCGETCTIWYCQKKHDIEHKTKLHFQSPTAEGGHNFCVGVDGDHMWYHRFDAIYDIIKTITICLSCAILPWFCLWYHIIFILFGKVCPWCQNYPIS